MKNKQLQFPKQYNENDIFQSDYPRGARLRVSTALIIEQRYANVTTFVAASSLRVTVSLINRIRRVRCVRGRNRTSATMMYP